MAGKKSKKTLKLAELSGLDDPRAPLDHATFLVEARAMVVLLTDDLYQRAQDSSAITRELSARHAAERKDRRTADAFDPWQRDLIVQIAAGWLLSCVFARVLEDRGLIERARIAGPGALDSQRTFLALAPSLTERDYLLTLFRELARLPGATELFGRVHNPMWKLAPSADAAKKLLSLFRTPSSDSPAFRFGQPDTRFLGDLYQELSEHVRKRYALLQTPGFVERFILDRTLGDTEEGALARFGLEDTTIIDPTCGSGHFLLGAFDRLYEHWQRAAPDLDERQTALKALARIHHQE